MRPTSKNGPDNGPGGNSWFNNQGTVSNQNLGFGGGPIMATYQGHHPVVADEVKPYTTDTITKSSDYEEKIKMMQKGKTNTHFFSTTVLNKNLSNKTFTHDGNNTEDDRSEDPPVMGASPDRKNDRNSRHVNQLDSYDVRDTCNNLESILHTADMVLAQSNRNLLSTHHSNIEKNLSTAALRLPKEVLSIDLELKKSNLEDLPGAFAKTSGCMVKSSLLNPTCIIENPFPSSHNFFIQSSPQHNSKPDDPPEHYSNLIKCKSDLSHFTGTQKSHRQIPEKDTPQYTKASHSAKDKQFDPKQLITKEQEINNMNIQRKAKTSRNYSKLLRDNLS